MKTQHAQLDAKFSALSERLAENDSAAIPGLLSEIRVLFDQHIALEADKLYPLLLEKAEAAGQQGQLLLAKSFQDGMNVITGALTRFFAKYQSATSIDVDAFAHDWNTMLHALHSRVQAEEVSLYPMFARLTRVRG